MHPTSQKKALAFGLIASTIVFCAVAAFFVFPPNAVQADPGTESPSFTRQGLLVAQDRPLPQDHPASDLACRSCHVDTEAVVTFPSGESVPAVVDMDALAASAHGDQAENPLACTSCHQPAEYQFPHPPQEAADLREFELAQSTACETCHQEPHVTSHPGPDSENPVACTDCHGSHEVLTKEQMRAGEGTEACVTCHTESGIEQVDAAALTALINSGLFAQQQVNSDYCLACHGQPGLTMEFPDGEVVSLTVDAQALHDSVHGASNEWDALICADCHTDYRFPHEPVEVDSAREYTILRNQTCRSCHERNFEKSLDSVHGDALMEGNLDAAVCTDCHGAHDTPVPDEPRARVSQICEQCHSEIYQEYAESVHGEALLLDDNEDVPTCIDCHGVHDIADPTTTLFRVRSPLLCAECHADQELMDKYDISTEVFNTYVADFHGTTTMLFDPEDPNAHPNSAVCYDCHGVHNIKSPDDPDAGIKENLLVTCQQCHPDATANFPNAWTSHFEPSLEHNTLVYLVNLFYQIIIPLTAGGLAFLVMTDVYRRVRTRLGSSSRSE